MWEETLPPTLAELCRWERRAGGATCTCGAYAAASTGFFSLSPTQPRKTPNDRLYYTLRTLPFGFKMVRHKKENFARGGKKFSNPRSRPVPRGDGNDDGEEGVVSARPAFKAACWDMGHCDPKRCSGKRLMKLGLMRDLHIGQRHPGVIVSYAHQSAHDSLA